MEKGGLWQGFTSTPMLYLEGGKVLPKTLGPRDPSGASKASNPGPGGKTPMVVDPPKRLLAHSGCQSVLILSLGPAVLMNGSGRQSPKA